MRQGRRQVVDWNKYKTWKFQMPRHESFSAECGAYALYAITKKPYEKILKLSDKGCWPTSVMMAYLKKNGFEVIPVTIGNMVESHSVESRHSKPRLTGKNVLLIDQKCYEEENTWSVIYGNEYAHSGDVEDLHPLEFINYPIEAAYLVYHKSWRGL